MSRIESDYLGSAEIPSHALYGIAAHRAFSHFPLPGAFSKIWYMSLGATKEASLLTVLDLWQELENKNIPLPDQSLTKEKIRAMIEAAREISKGEHFEHFIVPAISGGAGTAINMNINEIVANRALQILHLPLGNYSEIDPTLHANIFQSTNDVVPTSLKVAALRLLTVLEKNTADLRNALERIEQEHRHSKRLSYTQLQEALPSTWGRLFSTYAEALTRDWWRISKCWERIKVVNLGGGAIGSGLSIPRFYIFNASMNLAKLTGLPVVRAENMQDATANLDSIVEVHGIVRALAVNLIKMVSDIRLLSSDFHGEHVLKIPALTKGSSIMPGKINPIIPEYVISLCEKVKSNDQLIAHLCAQGQFELNAYLPLIGETLLEGLEMLNAAVVSAHQNMIKGLSINPAQEKLLKSPSLVTVLLSEVGYHKAEVLARHMKDKGTDIITANEELKMVSSERLLELLKSEKLLELGFSFKDKD